MKKVMLVSTLLLSFLSCKKEIKPPSYEIEGMVVEYGTDKPVANALVIATGLEGGEVFGSPGTAILLDSTRSDGDGHYKLAPTGFAVNALASKEGYFSQTSEKPVNGSGNLTLTLDPYAWVDLTLKNVSGAYELIYGITGSHTSLVDTGDINHLNVRVLGNRDVLVGISKKYYSIGYESISEEVYCPGHDTTYLYWEY